MSRDWSEGSSISRVRSRLAWRSRRSRVLFDAALEAARPALTRLAIQVERHEEADLEPIEVDPLLFTQVLVNLLVNAAEAMAPSGGSVEMTARRAHLLGRDQVAIRVADHGPGIPEGQLQELFKPFFTTKPQGTAWGSQSARTSCSSMRGGSSPRTVRLTRGRGHLEVQLPIVR